MAQPVKEEEFYRKLNTKEKFSLIEVVNTLRKNEKTSLGESKQVEETYEMEQKEIQTMREEITPFSKQNFTLERNLEDLDHQIKLLIKNQLNVTDLINQAKGLEIVKPAMGSQVLGKKSDIYGNMLAVLQHNPHYLAAISEKISGADIQLFVRTVVFDMYGDQYDSREERLLLNLFRYVLQGILSFYPIAKFIDAENMGSLFRANTAITQMLSAYSRRGQGFSVAYHLGLGVLRSILAQPLQELTARADLNLEVDPASKKWEKPRHLSNEEYAANEQVQSIIRPRFIQLQKIAQHFLDRIICNAEKIPYGMRWVCKQIAILAKKKFPEASKFKIGSLVGGYIYLRFFNPVIVVPDALNFIKNKPSKIMRRNLILVAKMLQNLSNGILFKDKEYYMIPLNTFLQANMEKIADYFDVITNVEDLSEALVVDDILANVQKRDPEIGVSINQLYLLQRTFNQLLQDDPSVFEEKDPLVWCLKKLGKAPAKVKKNADTQVYVLAKYPPGFKCTDKMMKEAKLRRDCSRVLTDIIFHPSLVPELIQAYDGSAWTFLLETRKWAHKYKLADLAKSCDWICKAFKSLAKHDRMLKGDVYTFANSFATKVAKDSVSGRKYADHTKKYNRVKKALACVSRHNNYLNKRLELYQQYLESVTRGHASAHHNKEKSTNKRTKKKIKKKMLQFKHKELEKMGVISRTDKNIRKDIEKCIYRFTNPEPGQFLIEVVYKKVVSVKVLKEPIKFSLAGLLKKQENGISSLNFDYVSLSVNLLIHLCNTKFLTK